MASASAAKEDSTTDQIEDVEIGADHRPHITVTEEDVWRF